MFRALIWKELRLQRATLVAMALVIAVCYGGLWQMLNWLNGPANQTNLLSDANLLISASFGMSLTAWLTAVCGAMPLALERRERSADFAAMLPMSRRCAIGAKLLVAIGIVVVAWAIHAAFALRVDLQFIERGRQTALEFATTTPHVWAVPEPTSARVVWETFWRHGDALPPAMVPASAGLAFFGIAWLIGAFVRHVEFAAGVSILIVVSGLVVAIQLASLRHEQHFYSSESISAFVTWAAILGAIALVAGTWHALRRVEP